MTTFPALQPLADRAAFFTALRQDDLGTAADALGPHRWDTDLAAGTLTFSALDDPNRTLVARAHLVASIAPGPRSVLWGWAHPNGGGDQNPAARLRAYGQEHGIAELSSPEAPFPADAAGDADWIAEASHVIAGVAVEVTGRSPYYSAPVGDAGTRAVLLLDAPLPPLTVAHAGVRMPRILSTTTPADPRSSVWDLARLAGWTLEWADGAFSAATVQDATGSMTFRFDEHARITAMESSLGGAAA
ncbi:DUF6882 domain-containing protein [Microbacterium sp. S1037]|uniref:DUF6882 domain-containing protein n=1 Tax=Microbacterium sp. S1037 TaxID=3398227 RepID=UPI003AAB4B36